MNDFFPIKSNSAICFVILELKYAIKAECLSFISVIISSAFICLLPVPENIFECCMCVCMHGAWILQYIEAIGQ